MPWPKWRESLVEKASIAGRGLSKFQNGRAYGPLQPPDASSSTAEQEEWMGVSESEWENWEVEYGGPEAIREHFTDTSSNTDAFANSSKREIRVRSKSIATTSARSIPASSSKEPQDPIDESASQTTARQRSSTVTLASVAYRRPSPSPAAPNQNQGTTFPRSAFSLARNASKRSETRKVSPTVS